MGFGENINKSDAFVAALFLFAGMTSFPIVRPCPRNSETLGCTRKAQEKSDIYHTPFSLPMDHFVLGEINV
jgi:hypothetical protein